MEIIFGQLFKMETLEKTLEEKAKELRRETFNLAIEHKDTHIASAFSCIEILVSLYDSILTKEDKFVLSKGHGCFSFYPALRQRGYNPHILGHPDIDEENGIHCTTGSLGHGLPISIGMAMAKKIKRKPGKVYTLLGDGECDEGTVWESSLIAPHYKLDNLTAIVDHNGLQAMDKTEKILSLGNLAEKFKVFGWYVLEANGHSFPEIIQALRYEIEDKPKMIIAHTIKGKGLSFMENDPKWQSRFPNEQELQQAYKELGIK
jgi:transketolase